MRTTRFESGLWNVICDRCGFKYKNTELTIEPRSGFMVCKKCWETWHPQEVIRPIPEQQKLPYTRPEPTDRTSVPSNQGSVVMLAHATSAVITNSLISASKRLVISGWLLDDVGVLSTRQIIGSGTATIFAAVAPKADWTIYYSVAG